MEKIIEKLKRKLSLVSFDESLEQLPELELENIPDAYAQFLPHICFGYDRNKNVDIQFTQPGRIKVENRKLESWFSLEVDIDDVTQQDYLVLVLDIAPNKTLPVKVCIRSEGIGDTYYPRVLMFSETKNKIEIPINIKECIEGKATVIIFFESESFEAKINEMKILLTRK